MKPERITELARKYTEHAMIRQHTELPEFPLPRIRLLLAALASNPATKGKSERYALAVALVQLGLDTHEEVDTQPGTASEQAMRSRQLKILAGDYFSSRFYNLLAQAGEISMIKSLSAAICEANRVKMVVDQLRKSRRLTADDYMKYGVQLRMELFTAFTELIDGQLQRHWLALLAVVSRCEALVQELARLDKPDQFAGSWAYWHLLEAGRQEGRMRGAAAALDWPGQADERASIQALLASRLREEAASLQELGARVECELVAAEVAAIAADFLASLASAEHYTTRVR